MLFVSHLSSVSVPGPPGKAGCDCGRGCGCGSAPLLRSDPPASFPSPSRAGSCCNRHNVSISIFYRDHRVPRDLVQLVKCNLMHGYRDL